MQNQKKQNGSVLVEVIIALSILLTVQLAAVTLAANSIKTGTLSKEKTQAVFLAQQGMEVIRNARDNNWKKGQDWDENFDTDGEYHIEYEEAPPKWKISTGTDPALIDGKFTRKITIAKNNDIDLSIPEDNIKRIEVEISWNNAKQKVTLVNYLTKWK